MTSAYSFGQARIDENDSHSSVRRRPTPASAAHRVASRSSQRPTSKDASASPSFRVYTADELKNTPLRTAHRPAASAPEGSSLLNWLGIGMGSGALVLVVIIALLPSGERADEASRPSLDVGAPAAPAMLAPQAMAAEPTAPAAAAETTDFELPDEPAAARSGAPVAKKTRARAPKHAP